MHARAIQHLNDVDPELATWIKRIGPIKLTRRRSREPFQALLESIAYQQLAGAAAKVIWGRVAALFEGGKPSPASLMAIEDEKLRGAGLSRSKVAAMKDIAAKAITGIVPDIKSIGRMKAKEIYERLIQIRGVGPWTVEMLLIFTLARPDIMPSTDYGVRKGLQVLQRKRKMPTPKQVEKIALRWQPHRTTAALYLWRIADSTKLTAKPKKKRA
jgi:DNA-3-methyladenine glycosylase II